MTHLGLILDGPMPERLMALASASHLQMQPPPFCSWPVDQHCSLPFDELFCPLDHVTVTGSDRWADHLSRLALSGPINLQSIPTRSGPMLFADGLTVCRPNSWFGRQHDWQIYTHAVQRRLLSQLRPAKRIAAGLEALNINAADAIGVHVVDGLTHSSIHGIFDIIARQEGRLVVSASSSELSASFASQFGSRVIYHTRTFTDMMAVGELFLLSRCRAIITQCGNKAGYVAGCLGAAEVQIAHNQTTANGARYCAARLGYDFEWFKEAIIQTP